MSTGQGSTLRRRAAVELGNVNQAVPRERPGLPPQRLSRQVQAAPKAAQRALEALSAVSGPAATVRALSVELAKLTRDVPARSEAFEHCLPVLVRALSAAGTLRPLERLNLVTSLERLMTLVGRSRHLEAAEAMAGALKPAAAELTLLARQRPSPFLCRLAALSAR